MLQSLFIDPISNRFPFAKWLTDLDAEFYRFSNRLEWLEYVAEYRERTLLGLFNNAVIRNSECGSLQEYHVYNGKIECVGRADLLITRGEHNLLIESKHETYNGYKLGTYDVDKMFDTALDQLKRYCESEQSYFDTANTNLAALQFEYIPNDKLEKFRQNLSGYNFETMRSEKVHFYAHYQFDFPDDKLSKGLMIYGRLYDFSGTALKSV